MRSDRGGEAEEAGERGLWRAATIEAEDELVEVAAIRSASSQGSYPSGDQVG
jgi:hypothetical protein